MQEEFRTAYKQLNTAQKEAVDIIDGPVLVVAGPGTGKTQLLSLRVANILQKTDTDPGSILCLTFTNFAATNMRERLANLVGPSAQNVMVRTFHSFAAEIMNLYPDYFWNGARLQIAPDAVQLEIIQEILESLPLHNPLAVKFAGTYTAISDVQQALKLAKEAGLTPEKLQAMLEVNIAYLDLIEPQLSELLSPALSLKRLPDLQMAVEALPDQPIDETITPLTSLSTVLKESLAAAVAVDQVTGKTTQSGKWKRRWLQRVNGQYSMLDERKRNAWWQALAEVYGSYRDHLHGQGYYDYSDMIVEVVSQLEQQPELLASVQERFLYVLIDEFQDTNAAQMRLAHLVANHSTTEGKPNLMAVGDDDQSIFAFNGAELNNMLTFRRAYPATKTIVLQDNYRSSQAILDMAGGIIEQAEDRLVKREHDLSKQLKAQAKVEPDGIIAHLNYPTREHQRWAIAKRIHQAWQQNQGQSMAVLARQHESLRELSAALSKLGVPIRYEQQNNVLDQPLVQQITLLAEIVVAIAEGDKAAVNHGVSALLAHPAWRVSPETLWKLATANYIQPSWLDSLLEQPEQQLNALAEWLLWLSRESSNEPLPVLLEYLIGLRAGHELTSPLREHFLANRDIDNQYLQGLSALNVLRDTAAEFSLARPGQTKLADFVRLVRLHRELDRPITDESWFMSGEQAVQLLTIHKAKGLEFDTVFLLDAIEENWRPRRMGRKPPANLPLQPYGEQTDDYVRLLYVAATRARHSLIVSSYSTDLRGQTLLATPLIRHLPMHTEEVTAESTVAVLEQALTWPRLKTNDERALLSDKLDNYRLSSTALLQFLDVTTGGPQRFLERQLLRLPELTTANMAYGTAIHKALQTAQQRTNGGSFNLPAILQAYETSLGKRQLTGADMERYKEHGRQTLTSLFKDKGYRLEKGGQPEVAIIDLRLGAVRLTGSLDLVNIHDQQLLITDYKTGKPLTSFATRDQTKAVKAWRHRTQLLFYALLAGRSGRFKSAKTISTQMLYVEAETTRELSLMLGSDQDDLQRLENLIAAVWRHIANLNLPDTSDYSNDAQGIANFEEDLLSNTV